jgi:hypothetical protein
METTKPLHEVLVYRVKNGHIEIRPLRRVGGELGNERVTHNDLCNNTEIILVKLECDFISIVIRELTSKEE